MLKLGHSALQKITIRDFLISTLRLRARALTSLKWSVIKVSREHPDWVCPIVGQSHNEQTRRHTRQITEHAIPRTKGTEYIRCVSGVYTHIRDY